MPRVQYANPMQDTNIVKAFPSPIKVGCLDAWFKAACKAVPEIPKTWYRSSLFVTEKSIGFELINPKTHERCAVVIARKD